jgi:hypothetical protein
MIGPLLIGLVSRVFALSVGFVSCGVLALLALVVAFPPWETVYYWFRRWRIDGTFERLNAELCVCAYGCG